MRVVRNRMFRQPDGSAAKSEGVSGIHERPKLEMEMGKLSEYLNRSLHFLHLPQPTECLKGRKKKWT